MSYWVYEYPTNRVRIHRATCSLCNSGRGMKGSRLPDNRGGGPLGTAQEDIDAALRVDGMLAARPRNSGTQRLSLYTCPKCNIRSHNLFSDRLLVEAT